MDQYQRAQRGAGRTRLFVALIGVGACLMASVASAEDSCIDDVWKQHGNTQNLTCTANDVRVASAGNIRDTNGDELLSCTEGEIFSFIADFRVVLGAQARYDIGLYFATDGDPNNDGAKKGVCDANVIKPPNGSPIVFGSPNFVNLDASPPDTCGDIDSSHNPQIVTVRVDNVLCEDSDGDGKLNLPNCTSWRVSGNNETCTTSNDAYPGSPSKCNCDASFDVPIQVETGTMSVEKTASPLTRDEPGGEFTYTVTTTNESDFTDITIDTICDDQYGKVAGSGTCAAGSTGSVKSTTCVLPQTLTAPDGFYTCTFKADFTSDVPATLTDIATVSGEDENEKPVSASDDAQVAVNDVAPAALIIKSLGTADVCAQVNYDVEVQNTSTVESLTLSDLTDDAFGDLTEVDADVLSTDCAVPQAIASGASYTCSFTAEVCASPHSDTITGTVYDDENTEINPVSNTLEVTITYGSE